MEFLDALETLLFFVTYQPNEATRTRNSVETLQSWRRHLAGAREYILFTAQARRLCRQEFLQSFHFAELLLFFVMKIGMIQMTEVLQKTIGKECNRSQFLWPVVVICAQNLCRSVTGKIEQQRGSLRSANLRMTVTLSFSILRKLSGHPCPQMKRISEWIRRK